MLEMFLLKSILLGIEKVFWPWGSKRKVLSIKHLRVSYLNVMKSSTKRNGALTLFESTSFRLYEMKFWRMLYGLNGNLATTTPENIWPSSLTAMAVSNAVNSYAI